MVKLPWGTITSIVSPAFNRSPTQFENSPPPILLTVTIQSPHDGATVNCTGVVVDCTGSKHTGYHISMVFTSMSKQAELRLNTMVFSRAL